MTAASYNNLFVGFISSILGFGQTLYNMFTGQIKTLALIPRAIKKIIYDLPFIPTWAKTFMGNNWLVTLIGGALGTILLAIIVFKLAMRIVNLINPVS